MPFCEPLNLKPVTKKTHAMNNNHPHSQEISQAGPLTTLPPLADTSNWPHPKPVPCAAKAADDGRCIITAQFPLPIQPVNDGYQIIEFHDKELLEHRSGRNADPAWSEGDPG